MGIEIERKFRVTGDGWRGKHSGILMKQGYLCRDKERTVRVRLVGDKGYLTVKGEGINGSLVRPEYEFEIPGKDAGEMLELMCSGGIIEKVRYPIEEQGMLWEVDEFHGNNEGLVLAEVELEDENQVFDLPDWTGQEVTGDKRYYNVYLTENPWTEWGKG